MASLTNINSSPTPHPHPDDDGSQNGSGGMERKTTAGIAIALICFFSLLGGFYIVSKWQRSARLRTRDDEESEMTYRRWADNVAGPGKERRARLQQEQQRSGFQPAPPYTPRRSSSSTKTLVPLDINTTLNPIPASPLPVYVPTGRNDSSQVNRPVSLQGVPTL